MIDRRNVFFSLLEIYKKLHRYDQIAGGGVFEV